MPSGPSASTMTGNLPPEALKSKKPDVMRLVGTEGSYGEVIGLPKDWAARIIRHVGNYGEIYDRNVGSESKLKSSRMPCMPQGLALGSKQPSRILPASSL